MREPASFWGGGDCLDAGQGAPEPSSAVLASGESHMAVLGSAGAGDRLRDTPARAGCCAHG